MLISTPVGEVNVPIWNAIVPSAMEPDLVNYMISLGRDDEIAVVGEQRFWIMGRITNLGYYEIVDPIKNNILVEEVNGESPDILTKKEYRFKIKC